MSVDQFEQAEIVRFAKIVMGQPRGIDNLIERTRAEHQTEDARADAMFAKVAAATRALVEPDEMFDRFEEVAELRRHMFEFLARQ